MLAAYAKCGVVSRACKLAKVGRATHYVWLDEDAEYRKAFEESHKHAVEYLESVARKRATRGWLEPVYHKGEVCGHVRRFSDTLLIFLLKGAAPEKYRDSSPSGNTTTNQQINIYLPANDRDTNGYLANGH
jgi:hypothetical protein